MALWKKKKFWIPLTLLLAGSAAGWWYYEKNRGIVEVQTGLVQRRDLTATVTATGEIKPRNYINIGANIMGRITALYVKEGDYVKKGQILARLESVQPEAEVAAQRASLQAARAEVESTRAALQAAEEGLRTAQAAVLRAEAELERARLNWERAQQLYQQSLIARQEFDQRKTEYEAAKAALQEARARVDQMEAQRAQIASQLEGAQRRVAVAEANLKRAMDQLQKTYVTAPLDGIVTNLPVRIGETVVPGIQNSPASLIMTIGDMSLITAEVLVDETDIVNVKEGQLATVTIEAMRDQTFHGRVIEIGNTAILRSSGLATSQVQVSSQEARDFRVVIALEDPPPDIRPGLSCTARIITATASNVLAVPIQALTMRRPAELKPVDQDSAVLARTGTEQEPSLPEAEQDKEIQGVFVVENGRAVFRPVETGIMGAAFVEVRSGLKEGEEIVIGSYRTIRTLRNGAKVRIAKPGSERKSD